MKKVIYTILLFGFSVVLSAQTSRQQVSHHLAFTGSGGADFAILTHQIEDYGLSGKIGGTADLAVLYELQKGNFFFNIGAGGSFLQNSLKMDQYFETFERVDKEAEPIMYNYHYSDYHQRSRYIGLTVPVQFGYYFGNVYVAAGARLTYGIWQQYKVNTQLMTDGTYIRFFDFIQTLPSYGFYEEDTYNYQKSGSLSKMDLLVDVEAGYRVLKIKPLSLRIGLYVQYGVLNQVKNDGGLVDLSAVDLSPLTQTQENLAANIAFRELERSAVLGGVRLSNLNIGVRLTLSLNFKKAVPCMCYEY